MGLHKIVNAAEPTDLQNVAIKIYVDSKAVVCRSGDIMTGELNMNNNMITHLPIKPTDKLEATSKVYVDGQDYKRVSKAGDVMTAENTFCVFSTLVLPNISADILCNVVKKRSYKVLIIS